VIGAALVMSVLLFLTSSHMGEYIENKKYSTMVLVWFTIHLVACFLQIAGDAWIITIFDETKVSKGSIAS
jgi:hypothetical protein